MKIKSAIIDNWNPIYLDWIEHLKNWGETGNNPYELPEHNSYVEWVRNYHGIGENDNELERNLYPIDDQSKFTRFLLRYPYAVSKINFI
jgi:hypothetical protein